MGGFWVLLIGVATLLLSHLYSWRPVRLKAWPITDILSHSLMLSGLLLLAGYFIYHNAPGIVWFVAAAATLVSVYGQLYNQLRDYDMDKAAGLYNTAIILGEANTRRVMYLTIAFALTCLLAAIVQGVFPLWLGIVVALSMPVSMLYRPIRTCAVPLRWIQRRDADSGVDFAQLDHCGLADRGGGNTGAAPLK